MIIDGHIMRRIIKKFKKFKKYEAYSFGAYDTPQNSRYTLLYSVKAFTNLGGPIDFGTNIWVFKT